MSLSVTRIGSLNQLVSVDYVFSNVTANNGSDYSGLNGTITLPIGVSSNDIFLFRSLDNGIYELTETFNVVLNNPVKRGLD